MTRKEPPGLERNMVYVPKATPVVVNSIEQSNNDSIFGGGGGEYHNTSQHN